MVGHTSAFFLFPAPAGPGFPYSPYLKHSIALIPTWSYLIALTPAGR